jgi:hypothetical protein
VESEYSEREEEVGFEKKAQVRTLADHSDKVGYDVPGVDALLELSCKVDCKGTYTGTVTIFQGYNTIPPSLAVTIVVT